MGGSSSVRVRNFADLSTPLINSYEGVYNSAMTNHGEWYGTYVEYQEQWQKAQQENIDRWFKVNFGEDGKGGIYAEARASEEKWRKVQLAIAGMQQVASLYFANKQYQSAKEAQDHQIEVWKTEKEWAKQYQDLWYDHYRPLELKLISKIMARANDPDHGKPRYDVAQSRSVVMVRSEFAKAREQVRKCIDPRCVGSRCDTLKQLAIEEAKSAVGAMDKAFRFEEAKSDIKQAQNEEAMLSLANLGRGLQTSSLNALNSASTASKVASTFNPYEGYESAVGSAFGYWHQYSADRSIRSGSIANQLNRQGAGYMMTGNYQRSNPSNMTMTMQQPQPSVTGQTGFQIPTQGSNPVYDWNGIGIGGLGFQADGLTLA